MPLNEQSRPSLARGVRLRNDPKTGEPLLLFPEGVLFLSQTAKEIVELCNGQNSVADISTALAKAYESEADVLGKDVLDCVADLSERKLVVF